MIRLLRTTLAALALFSIVTDRAFHTRGAKIAKRSASLVIFSEAAGLAKVMKTKEDLIILGSKSRPL
jgi:hypothetical protein